MEMHFRKCIAIAIMGIDGCVAAIFRSAASDYDAIKKIIVATISSACEPAQMRYD